VVLNFPGFVVASLIGRGARFFLVAGFVVAGGERMETMVATYIERIGWGVVALVVAVGGYVWFDH
jgi:membrane protein DedA with SNARE-associated domain